MDLQEELLKIAYDESKKRRIIDLQQVVEIMREKLQVEEYLTELIIDDTSVKDGFGYYNFDSLDMIVYEKALLKSTKRYQKSITFQSDFEMYFFNNLWFYATLYHEFCHVLQNKELENMESNSLEKKLTELSFKKSQDILKKIKEGRNSLMLSQIQKYLLEKYYHYLSNKTYSLDPTERIAKIRSHLFQYELANRIKEKVPTVVNFFDYATSCCQMYAYQESDIPIINYIHQIHIEEVLEVWDLWGGSIEKLKENSLANYNLEERMLYSLYVTEKEKTKLALIKAEKAKKLSKSLA